MEISYQTHTITSFRPPSLPKPISLWRSTPRKASRRIVLRSPKAFQTSRFRWGQKQNSSALPPQLQASSSELEQAPVDKLAGESDVESDSDEIQTENGLNRLAEAMECLEEKAMVGEDEGRDLTDYNRRAHLFAKSSRVFQALKEREERFRHEPV